MLTALPHGWFGPLITVDCVTSICRRAEQLVAQAAVADFNPAAFEKELVKFAETEEYIVRGGREKFKNLPAAMKVRHRQTAAAGLEGWGPAAAGRG